MNYKLSEIEYVEVVKLSGFKSDSNEPLIGNFPSADFIDISKS